MRGLASAAARERRIGASMAKRRWWRSLRDGTLYVALILLALPSGAFQNSGNPPGKSASVSAPAGNLHVDTPPNTSSHISGVDIESLPQTIGIEHSDRIRRFHRLADLKHIEPPDIDDMAVPAGLVPGFNYPIPVVRLRFKERVFFDFDKDTLLPGGEPVLDLIAESMRRDLPDVKLTIIGHTDAIGSDAYNYSLSSRRARNVMEALYLRGVRLYQMSTVAVGKTQPVAPNSTAEGRARNRRVEFMISESEQANLLLVSKRRVICEYLSLAPEPPSDSSCAMRSIAAPRHLEVKKLVVADRTSPGNGTIDLKTVGTIEIEKPQSIVEIRRIAPIPNVKVVTPAQVHQAQLRQEFDM
jgi:outer membrane protein OmpA-like peptidoglycan-associated protein